VLAVGDTFDRYVIEALLGEGGMGTVYRARDVKLDRRVALKLVRDDGGDDPRRADRRERLLREARAAAALSHPNAAHVYDVGEVDGTAYVAMELVRGKTLRAALDDGASVAQRVSWLCDAGKALAAAHAAGIVHRDVKPENVMVAEDGAVKVLDFGIARRSSTPVDASAPTSAASLGTLTSEGVQLGTPLYMAPEQIRGLPLDGRSDQFAWAVVAYEVLGGKPPWNASGDALALVASILTDSPPALNDVPPAVDAVLRRALSKSPDDRFASMDDATAALARALEAPAAKPSIVTTSDLKRYSDAEIEEILQRALEEPAAGERRISLRELREAAREVGVDDRRLDKAAREVERKREKEGIIEGETDGDQRGRKVRGFFRHLASYAIVCSFMTMMMGFGVTRWMIYSWGMGLAFHALSVLFPSEKKRRRRDRKRLRAATPAIDEGVSLLLKTAEQRVRVATGGDAAHVEAEEEHVEGERDRRRRLAGRGSPHPRPLSPNGRGELSGQRARTYASKKRRTTPLSPRGSSGERGRG
jgi:serine/threonine-protein kinase